MNLDLTLGRWAPSSRVLRAHWGSRKRGVFGLTPCNAVTARIGWIQVDTDSHGPVPKS